MPKDLKKTALGYRRDGKPKPVFRKKTVKKKPKKVLLKRTEKTEEAKKILDFNFDEIIAEMDLDTVSFWENYDESSLMKKNFIEAYFKSKDLKGSYKAAFATRIKKKNTDTNDTNIQKKALSLLREIPCQLYLRKLESELMKRTMVTKEWVVYQLIENLNRAMQVEAVLDVNGEPTGVYVYNGQVANKSLELIGKHVGMFQDHKHLHFGGNVRMSLEDKRERLMKKVLGEEITKELDITDE